MRSEPRLQLRPVYPVRTPRLLLRPLTLNDADDLVAYRSRPDVCRYVPFGPLHRAAVVDRLVGPWATTVLTDEGQSLTLGIEVAETGGLVGEVSLCWRSREHRSGELGYAINPAFAGRGYATEAARATLGLGFDELGLHRITASIDERNEPSVKLARRLGMRQEARFVRPDAGKLRREAAALRSRKDGLAGLLADGVLTEAAVRRESAKLSAKLTDLEAALADSGRVGVLGPLVGAEDVRAVWEGMDTDRQRAVIEALFLTVTLLPPGRGTRFGQTVESWEDNAQRISDSIVVEWA